MPQEISRWNAQVYVFPECICCGLSTNDIEKYSYGQTTSVTQVGTERTVKGFTETFPIAAHKHCWRKRVRTRNLLMLGGTACMLVSAWLFYKDSIPIVFVLLFIAGAWSLGKGILIHENEIHAVAMKGKLASDLLTQLMNPQSFAEDLIKSGLSKQSYNIDPIEFEKGRKEYSQTRANIIIEKCGKEEGTKLVQRIIAFAIANGASRNITPDIS